MNETRVIQMITKLVLPQTPPLLMFDVQIDANTTNRNPVLNDLSRSSSYSSLCLHLFKSTKHTWRRQRAVPILTFDLTIRWVIRYRLQVFCSFLLPPSDCPEFYRPALKSLRQQSAKLMTTLNSRWNCNQILEML